MQCSRVSVQPKKESSDRGKGRVETRDSSYHSLSLSLTLSICLSLYVSLSVSLSLTLPLCLSVCLSLCLKPVQPASMGTWGPLYLILYQLYFCSGGCWVTGSHHGCSLFTGLYDDERFRLLRTLRFKHHPSSTKLNLIKVKPIKIDNKNVLRFLKRSIIYICLSFTSMLRNIFKYFFC